MKMGKSFKYRKIQSIKDEMKTDETKCAVCNNPLLERETNSHSTTIRCPICGWTKTEEWGSKPKR